MRIQALSVWNFISLLAFGYAVSYDDFAFPNDESLFHNYSRFTEVENHCHSFISSASVLEYADDHNMASRLKNKLSFFNGDWKQDQAQESYRTATLMPFDDSDMPIENLFSFISPWKVVSFEVQNVSFGVPHQPKNTVSISGVLSIGITRNTTLISEPYLKFHTTPGMSALRVDFEGVYLETKENGGERLVCMLGNSVFPFKKVPKRYSDGYITTYFAVEETYNEGPLLHENIMLVLRYPKTLSLFTSGILGEMQSLSEDDEYDYFDKIHITSYLDIFPEYHMNSSKEFILEDVDENPLQDAIIEDGVNKFTNIKFCDIIKNFEQQEYRVMPNLIAGGPNWYQKTVGPFLLNNEIQSVGRNNEILRVILHKVRCEKDQVSGVLRLYPDTITPDVAARRTGLSTLTLLVKGAWNSSTGLLSMTGCLGPTLVTCDSGVLLYFPRSFSSKQRSLVSGSIFSFKNATKAFHPVFIGLEMLSPGLYDGGSYSRDHLSYNYSKIDLSIKFRERIQEPHLITCLRESIFDYPALGEENDGIFKISNRLSDDLKIDTFSSPETFVRLEVLSLGPLFRTNDALFYEVSNHEVLNISLNFLLKEKDDNFEVYSYHPVTKLYLEGVYDQRVGKPYLIGCRKVDYDYVDLERGLDCLIEVTIQYSPINTRWLVNPSADINIFSKRNEDDYYHFKPIHLKNIMIHDKTHEQNVIFRKIFEGYFRVFLVSMYIAHILSLMKDMKKSSESVPYISISMLALWIVGYGITLITSKEIVIKSSESTRYMNHPYDLQSYKGYLNNLDYLARFLILVTIFLMARIAQIVLKARAALREQGKSSPSEKKVILVSLIIYICYFLFSISMRGFHLYLNEVTFPKDVYIKAITEVCWYTVLNLQDYFLIPELVAFHIWKRHTSGSLFNNFVIRLWITILIHFVYEIIRSPIGYPV
uniref:uncharacterized protein LOC122591391 n=1 Tax=Erigeron canadensis TaxID=72917 RepID=UPI001CB96904|nr:uncharacterized protein LOC122591391 [Erigeron canadensis]